MSVDRRCRFCKYFTVKRALLGRRKTICAMQKCEVQYFDVCSQFVRDAVQVMEYAGFKDHVYGSPDACHSCTHCKGNRGDTGIVYICKKNDVEFWSGFSPLDYVCNNYEDGGLDTLIARTAEAFSR